MPANSFDITSNIELPEVSNAIHQTSKEIVTRYDLKNTKSTVELDSTERKIVIHAPDEFILGQVVDVLQQKLVRRQVPMKGLTFGNVQQAAGATVVQEIALQSGIPMEKCREIVKLIKTSKIKVQASIQGEQVRVSGKNRDDLQKVIALLKENDLGIDMQYTNYRTN
jgi:uncharacterized protein YajQ (UPF0234 family)